MKNNLAFREKPIKTNADITGAEREYMLAEAIINDRPFLDFIDQIESGHEYECNIAKSLCFELTGESDPHGHWSGESGWTPGWQDGWPGENRAALLVCGKCFHERDNPLVFEFEETDTAIVWRDFRNPQTKRDYAEIPAFRFEKGQYGAAMAELKKIASARADL